MAVETPTKSIYSRPARGYPGIGERAQSSRGGTVNPRQIKHAPAGIICMHGDNREVPTTKVEAVN